MTFNIQVSIFNTRRSAAECIPEACPIRDAPKYNRDPMPWERFFAAISYHNNPIYL